MENYILKMYAKYENFIKFCMNIFMGNLYVYIKFLLYEVKIILEYYIEEIFYLWPENCVLDIIYNNHI